MSKYVTLVIQISDDAENKSQVHGSLRQLASLGTALTDEDKQSVLAELERVASHKDTTSRKDLINGGSFNLNELAGCSAALSLFERIHRLPPDEKNDLLTLLKVKDAMEKGYKGTSINSKGTLPKRPQPTLSVVSNDKTNDKSEPL